jgi:ATP-dependent Clp protease ATP-binding subunit ClpA
MMFERLTADSRVVIVHAQQHARRLGHRYVGCEHLLLALVATGQPAGVVLREQGLDPEWVEEEIVRRVGLGAGAGLFGDLDQDALSAIGIDLDAVRARVEASFGPEDLTLASQAVHRPPRPSALSPHHAVPRLVRSWRRRVARHTVPAAPAPGPRPAEATGRYRATGALPTGHLPFTPGAKRSMENSFREAQARRDEHIGVEHLALALLTMNSGLVPPILSAAGTSGPAVRAAILHRYRQAG